MLVDDRDQSIKLHERILKRSGGEKNLKKFPRGLTELLRTNRRSMLINVPQPMSFVEDDQIPIDVGDFVRLCGGELIGCDDDLVSAVERQKFAGFARVLVALAFD